VQRDADTLARLATAGVRVHIHTDNAVFSGSEEGWTRLVERYRALGGPITVSWRASGAFDQAVHSRLGHGEELTPLVLPREGTLPMALPRWRRAVSDVRQVITSAQPQIVHSNNGGWPGALSALAGVVAADGRPVAMVVNNLAYPYTQGRRLARPLERSIAARVGAFVTASHAAAQQLENVLDLRRGSVMPIPNAIREPSNLPSRQQARAQVGVDNALVVACVARLEERKGHDKLLAAWQQIDGLARSTALLIVGDGPLRDALRARAAELQQSGFDVRVLGQVDEIWPVYACADVVVLPSTMQEDMPLTLIEAMCAGRPVIATDVAGAKEVVADGVTGVLVAPNDVAGLAQALHFLLTDPQARERLATNANKRYRDHYTEDSAVNVYAQVWESLLNPRSHAQN
jgi:glycosyltransferase involved in cell wall biosynthesis